MTDVLKICGAGDAYGVFHCPGCDRAHTVRVAGAGAWGWNDDVEHPTLTPSVLVTYNGQDAGIDGAPPAVCHSFVRDGLIQFLADCTHSLAGQTVPVGPWPDQVAIA